VYFISNHIFVKTTLMKNLKIIIRHVIVLLMLVGSPCVMIAQGPPPDPCPDNTLPDCPIDSGVVVLCGAVLLVAFKKTYDYQKSLEKI
jgi:hypothetical protein